MKTIFPVSGCMWGLILIKPIFTQVQQLHCRVSIMSTGIPKTCNVFINAANVFYLREIR